jgi:two-component system sensor histidine kinase DesK
VLTYLPFVVFGHQWMSGNSGFLLGAVLLTAGPVAGLPLAIGIAAGDVVLTYSVLHMSGALNLAYPAIASVDNGVQFWGLVTLAQAARDLRAERGDLARVAAAAERSRADRMVRAAFGRLLSTVEGHVDSALQDLETSPSRAAEEVAAAVRTARECQAAVRAAADEPVDPDAHWPITPKPASVGNAVNVQLVAVAALGLLLLNYCLQAVADAVDGYPTSLTVTGMAAMILVAIVVLWRGQGESSDVTPRVAAWVRVVAVAGLVAYPVAVVAVAVLTPPAAGVWVGFGCLALGGLVILRSGISWSRLMVPVVGGTAVTLLLTPAGYGSGADVLYIIGGAVMVVLNSFGMVRLVQSEGALARTRRRAVTLAALRERTRVARDVHDLLGLGITTMVLKGELAARLLDTEPGRARRHLLEMRELAAEAAVAAGAIGGEGREASVGSELLSAERTLAGAGIAVDVRMAAGICAGAMDAVLGVILREAITNVLRHSTAEKVRIDLGVESGRAVLRVENDGLREASASVVGREPSGRGLGNIASRVAEAGGDFDAGVSDGWFRLSVGLPV